MERGVRLVGNRARSPKHKAFLAGKMLPLYLSRETLSILVLKVPHTSTSIALNLQQKAIWSDLCRSYPRKPIDDLSKVRHLVFVRNMHELTIMACTRLTFSP